MKNNNHPEKHIILLTNDDGFFSKGITALAQYLSSIARVFIVAPDREKSATSLALTLNRPLRVQQIKEDVYAVDGTPADCIYLGLKLLPRKPDLIISGLNQGPNLGQQDISYSGTVAGAIQGTFLQIPSIAISLLPDKKGDFAFELSAQSANRLAKYFLFTPIPEGVTINVNIPPPPFKGIKVTTLGQRRYDPEIIEKKDPKNRSYYWIGPGNPRTFGDGKSDINAVKEGYIAVTPLHTDLTDYRTIQSPDFRRIVDEIEREIC